MLSGLLLLGVASCAFGSKEERSTGRHIDLQGFDEISRSTYMQKSTYYVRLRVDASLDQLKEAALEGTLLASEPFESVGHSSGKVVGVFIDRQTGCQFDLVAGGGPKPVELTAGVVCPD